MPQLRLQGEPEITVRLRRNAQARRLCLRVSQLDGHVTLTIPRAASTAQAQAFARQKEPWIRRQLGARLADVIPRIGGTILFEGSPALILPGPGRAAQFTMGQIRVPGDTTRIPPRIAALLKIMARQRLCAACQHYSDVLGVKVKRITLRDTRSRWGSCSHAGNLMFSWRLIMAPPEVLAYVAAHEVAHLVEMNHSGAYWKVLAGISPDFKTWRHWLRQNGALLHIYRFAQLTRTGECDHTHPC